MKLKRPIGGSKSLNERVIESFFQQIRLKQAVYSFNNDTLMCVAWKQSATDLFRTIVIDETAKSCA